MSRVSSPLCCVCSWALWAEPMHVSRPGRESYHTYQIIARAFICFNHLTDQAFSWDQAAIWDKRLIPSSQKWWIALILGWKCHKLRQPLCEFSGVLLQVKLLRRRKRFSQPALASKLLISAVTHSGVHLFRHRHDHFSHSLMACLFPDHLPPHVYLKLLASLLPTSTRQPGPVAVLLGQTLKLSFIFFANLSCSWLRW